jgi:hypothetical protein
MANGLAVLLDALGRSHGMVISDAGLDVDRIG